MTSKKGQKRLHLSVLEEAVRNATRIAFKEALANGKTWLNADQIKNLTLGTIIEDDVCIFFLYIAREKPADGLIVSKAIIDRYCAKLLNKVDVFLPPVDSSHPRFQGILL